MPNTGSQRKYIILVNSIVPLVGELKEEFKYQPVYINIAQARLQRARAIMNDKHGNRETLFVAVHVRRTDYTGYLRRKGVTVTADINYYRHAVAWMLRKLISDSASSRNIAFILASDDKVWCKAKLLPEIQEEIQSFGNETNLGGSSVFYLGDVETPKLDLVMLSSCNHSIISYGTYGLWSALMVNGWTVVYDMSPHTSQNKKARPNKTIFLLEVKPTCPKGVVTVVDGGRLCNKILEYVSVWSLSRSYGLVPYVPDSIHSALRNVFTQLRIPPFLSCIILIDLIVPLIGVLKEEFKYQPVYTNSAQARLRRARANVNDEHGN
uniref:L-Fucosyltransferase n=1 Tax=Timema bartmani TaxID=61472 RepID=A0A7R9HVD4_9NEOP|nr:unnamed protein product [Timema bartmani]